jgi:hypothetical protein
VGRTLSTEVRRTEWLYRLHYATNGVVGNVMNLLRFAALLSELRGRNQLDLDVCALAFQQRLIKHMRGALNPFSEPATTRFTPPASSAETLPASRPRHRAARDRSIADILTTR